MSGKYYKTGLDDIIIVTVIVITVILAVSIYAGYRAMSACMNTNHDFWYCIAIID